MILFFEKTWLFWWMFGLVAIIRWSRAHSVDADQKTAEELQTVEPPVYSGLPSKPSG